MNFNISHVTSNPIILCSTVLAGIGWLLTFIAACVTHLHGASWWIVIYEFGLMMIIYLVLKKSMFNEYQLLLLILLAISIAMLTQLIEMFMNRTDQGSHAGAAGGCMLVIMQYLWVFIFGSTEQSAIVCSIYGMQHSTPLASQTQFSNSSYRSNIGGSLRSIGTASSYRAQRIQRQQERQQKQFSEKQQMQQRELSLRSNNATSQKKNSRSVSTSNVSDVNNNNTEATSTLNVINPPLTPSEVPATPTSIAPTLSVLPTNNDNNNNNNTSTLTASTTTVLKKNNVKALHAYRANLEDPNELSFEKHEVLEILDKRGNWWQAKKKDGSIGIVPSNYFAA
ncbi:hypothetical protein BDC45DRAFT_526111 [Circinella umbellata]|nr:hypothetical protein BDC45DRAFT_526111 [Circinella umbellata]